MEEERCCDCDDLTGRAGQADDSLYVDYNGPYCSDCYKDKLMEYLEVENIALKACSEINANKYIECKDKLVKVEHEFKNMRSAYIEAASSLESQRITKNSKISALQARNAELEKALKKYGAHSNGPFYTETEDCFGNPCVCGLDQALGNEEGEE